MTTSGNMSTDKKSKDNNNKNDSNDVDSFCDEQAEGMEDDDDGQKMVVVRSKTADMSLSSDDSYDDKDGDNKSVSVSVSGRSSHSSRSKNAGNDNAVATVKTSEPHHQQISSSSNNVVWPFWTRCTDRLHATIRRFVVALSLRAARNPKTCIVTVIVFSLALLATGFFTNFEINVNEEEIYAPFKSIPHHHLQWRENDSGFEESTRVTLLILHNDGQNVLGKQQVSRVLEALDTVRNTSGYVENCEDGAYWDEYKKEFTCRIESVTRAWYHDVSVFEQQVQTDRDVIDALSLPEYPGGAPINHELVLGNFEREETDNSSNFNNYNKSTSNATPMLTTNSYNQNQNSIITYAPAYLVYILLTNKGDETMELETRMIQNLNALQEQWAIQDNDNDNSLLKLDFFVERTFGDEFKRAIEDDMYLVPVIFFLMSGFTCLVFYQKDRVQSRCLVGVGSVATIGMSLFTGFGLLFLCGVPYTSMTQLLPFLVFGVGLDDTFIITGVYMRMDDSIEPEERLRLTMEEVGTCISVTTITTVTAFLLGLMSTVPAIYWLCLYAFPTILIDFIYQITFFVAILMIDERRVQANRKDICFCCSADSTTKVEEDHGDDGIDVIQEEQYESEPQTKKHFADRVMTWYARQLMRPFVKVFVLVVFTCFFAFCVYRTTMLKQEFDIKDLFPKGSYATKALTTMNKFQERTVSVEIIFRDINQSDPDIQQQMIDFIDDITALAPFGAPPPFCWVRDFKAMEDSSFMDALSDLSFEEKVEYALSIPAINEVYGGDIVLDDQGQIQTSMCRIIARNSYLEKVQDQIDLLRDQREVTNDQPINQGRDREAFFTFNHLYAIWEFYRICVAELIGTTVSSVLAVSLVALIFIPHWTAVFFMVPMICMVYIDLMGVMQLAGLYINAVTYVCLVISVGLIVDFLMHIILRYNESPKATREAKVIETLETMGASILLGGLSTFLGIVPLALSTSTVLRTVFTSMCSMVLLGITHGLIMLPVLLSVSGPVTNAEHSSPALSKDDKSSFCCDTSSDGSPVKKMQHATSMGSLDFPNSSSPGEKSKQITLEEFLLNCAEVMARDTFPHDPMAARQEKAELFEYYTNIYKTTSDPFAFLVQLRHQTSHTVEDAC